VGVSFVIPEYAASVIVLRPSDNNFDVLMVERHGRGFFGSLVVFPGGKVDPADKSELARSVVSGEGDNHEFRGAALRELAEETGLAATSNGVVVAPSERDGALYRAILDSGDTLAGELLVLVSRWVTPETAPRRFDTFFYILPTSTTPDVRLDEDELVDHAWVSPTEALHRHEDGEWKMITPTLAHLRWLQRRSSIEDALASADGADGRALIEPRRLADGSMLQIDMPGELP
jgi:8-oxo-dGTP pyrophosphatase MutT (NUDIX family)